MSRCVFVYCDGLEKGFVTRLSPEQRIDLIYKQIDEVLLTGTDYELVTLELSDKAVSGKWILPAFLRLKDLHFDAAIYAKAVVRKKPKIDTLSLLEPLASPGVETPEQTEEKDNTAVYDEDPFPTAPEKTKSASGKKPPLKPQNKRAIKRGSNASSPQFNAKKTKIASTQKKNKAMEKFQHEKEKKHERTIAENAPDSQDTIMTLDMESPSSSNDA